MKRLVKRWISILLCAVMLAGVPLGVRAEAPPEDTAPNTAETFAEQDAPAEEAAEPSAEQSTPTDLEAPEEEPEVFPEYDVADSVAAAADSPNFYSDIFGSLGLKTREADQKRMENSPYGDNFTVTVNELFITGYTQAAQNRAMLIGKEAHHNNSLSNQFVNYQSDMSATLDYRDLKYAENEVAVSFEGDFDGDGRKGHVVTLRPSADGRAISASVADMGMSGHLANYDAFTIRVDNMTGLNSQFLYRPSSVFDLNLATGDLNGDGFDEIIYLIPDVESKTEPRAKIMVLSMDNPTSPTAWKDARNWHPRVYSIGIGFGGTNTATFADRRTQSLAVGDLDGDGKDDVAVASSWLRANFSDSKEDNAWAELNVFSGADFSIHNPKGFTAPVTALSYHNKRASETNTLFGAHGLMQLPTAASIGLDATTINNSFPGNIPNNAILFSQLLPIELGIDIVDAGNGSRKELLLGYNYYVGANRGTASSFVPVGNPYAGYQVEPLHIDKGTGKLAKVGATLPSIQTSTLEVIKAYGSHKDAWDMYYLPFFHSDDTTRNRFSTLNEVACKPIQLTAARMSAGQPTPTIIVDINQHNLDNGAYRLKEYKDFSNGSSVALPATFFPYPLSNKVFSANYSLDRRCYSVLNVRPAIMSSVETPGGANTPHFGFVVQYNFPEGSGRSHTEFVSGNNTAKPTLAAANINGFARSFTTYSHGATFCLPDTDLDSPKFTYKGYDFLHSDPTVIAALAAPPYAKDIAALEDGYTNDFATTYSFSVGTGYGKVDSGGSYVGPYISADAQLGAGPFKFAMEFEGEYNRGWNEENESLTEFSEEMEMSTSQDDMVVVMTTPMDVYAYEVEYATDQAATQTAVSDYIIHTPYTPVVNMIPLEDYDRAYQRFSETLPDIAGEVFTHEVGYPDTYVYDYKKYRDSFESSNSAALPPNSASIKHTWNIDYSETKTVTTTNSLAFKVGGGAKYGGTFAEVQVTAGVSFGFEWTEGGINTNTKGASFSGGVGGSDYHRLSPYRDTTWKMVQFNHYGVQNFPVVTYDVKVAGSEGAYLYQPEEYGIDDSDTTKDRLSVYWTPSRNDERPGPSSNLTYSVYRKERGNESGEATEVGEERGYRYEPLTGRYVMLDTGLKTDTTYEYYVVCQSSSAPSTDAIRTPTFLGTTSPDDRSYIFTVQPEENLVIRPGEATSVTAQFAKGELDDKVKYSWQKFETKWSNVKDGSGNYLSGHKTNTLSILTPVPDLEGRYRLMATYDERKSYYSDEVLITYKPKETTVELSVSLQGMSAANTDLVATATVTPVEGGAVRDNTDVRFVFTMTNGTTVIKTAKVKAGVASASIKTDKAGMYGVQAIYVGDDVYASSQSDTVNSRKVGSGGIFLTHPLTRTQYYYGDVIPASVTVYPIDSGLPVVGIPELDVYKYVNGVLSTTPETGWVDDHIWYDTPVRDVTIKGVGKYCLKLKAWQSDATPAYFDFTVKPRPVSYDIQDLTVYTLETPKTDIPDLLQINYAAGSLQMADESEKYDADDLVVYGNDNTPVTDFDSLGVGTYRISVSPESLNTSPNYDITVKTGLLTISDLPTTNLAQVFYDSEGPGRVEAVLPASLRTGGYINKNAALTLEAVPDKPYYVFEGWSFDPEQSAGNLTQKGNKVTIKKVGDNAEVGDKPLNVTATFAIPTIAVGPANTKVDRGGQQSYKATLPRNLGDGMTWGVEGETSDGTSIDENGTLTVSETEGAKVVTVTVVSDVDSDVKGSVAVTINQPALYLTVWSQTLTEEYTNATIKIGEKRDFKVMPVPTDRQAKDLEVTSSKSSVAKVTYEKPTTGNGGSFSIEGVAVGTAVLTVTLTAGEDSISLPFTVRVMSKDADQVTAKLKPETATLVMGKTLTLAPQFTPTKASITSMSWESGDKSIATVDSNGVVTAVAPGGPVTITMTAKPWNAAEITAKCEIEVTAPATGLKITDQEGGVPPKTLTLAAVGDNATPVYDASIQLKAAVTPEKCTDAVVWSSSNSEIAAVDPATGEVTTAGKAGSATITATAGAKKATCKITVVMTVKDFGVKISKDSLSMQAGASAPLTATVEDRSELQKTTNKKVAWTSSDTSVATVNSKGVVTALRDGTAVIQVASVENPALDSKCTVTVAAPITSMVFVQKPFTLKAGELTTVSLSFNKGKVVSGLGTVTLTTSDAEALAFRGDDPSTTTASYTLKDAYDVVELVAGDLTTDKATVTITAKTERADDNKPFEATLNITVIKGDTDPVTSLALTSASAKKAPGSGGYAEDSPNPPLAVGASYTPAVTIKPSKVSDKNITWTLSALSSQLVDPLDYVDFDPTSGKITAKRPCDTFTTLVLAGEAHGSGVEMDPIMFQTAKRMSKLSLQAAGSTTLVVGDTLMVSSTASPSAASHTNLKWTSSNPDVLEILKADGMTLADSMLVTARKAGKVTLKATAVDGSKKSASIKITVRQAVMDIAITNKAIEGNDIATVSVTQGKTLPLKAGLNMGNWIDTSSENPVLVKNNPAPTSKAVTWSLVDGEGVVSVNSKTGVVKALSYGTATVEVVPAGQQAGSYSTDATVHDLADPANPKTYRNIIEISVDAPVKSMKLAQKSFSIHVPEGQTESVTLNAIPNPVMDKLSPDERALVWSIPNKAGLDFDTSDGGTRAETDSTITYTTKGDASSVALKVSSVKKDTSFKVTVTANSKKKAALTITLKADPKKAPAVRGLNLKQSALWLKTGKSTKLAVSILPKTAGNKNLSWSIEEYMADGSKVPEGMEGSVATVDASGKVTAKGSGHAVVTVTSMDGGYKATCTVYCMARS